MSSLLKLCERYFGSRDLYEVLNIEQTASAKEVRKAYHKLSLSCHPDRVEEDEKIIATEKFKVLGQVHSVLSDEEKRSVYDDNGICDGDDSFIHEERDWVEYWRVVFQKVTIDDIQKYEKEYKGSDEELKDLKRAYVNGKGDMDKIYESVPFLTLDEEDRIRARLQKLINSKELTAYKLFTDEPKAKRARRIRKLKREAREAENEMQKKKKKEEENGLGELAHAVLARRRGTEEDFLASLEKRYSNSSGSKKPAKRQKQKK